VHGIFCEFASARRIGQESRLGCALPYSEWRQIALPRPQTAVIKADCIAARLARSFELSSAPPPSDIIDLTWLELKKVDSALAGISHKPIRLAPSFGLHANFVRYHLIHPLFWTPVLLLTVAYH
jgi:hypothetical protein